MLLSTSTCSVTTAALFALIVLLLAKSSDAVVPVPCTYNVTVSSGVCCPRSPGNNKVCGGRKRGECVQIAAPLQYVPGVFKVDDRVGWPLRFFSYACQCQGNFFGVSCDECWFGWTGSNCDQPKMMVRTDIRRLSNKDRRIYIDVVTRSLHWPSGYAVLDESDNYHSDPLTKPRFEETSIQHFIAYTHRYGSRSTLFKSEEECNTYGILDFIHDGPVFPTWHRYYVLIWEQLLGKIAKQVYGIDDFPAVYWDWVGMKECDICTNDYLGAPGKRDQFGTRISTGSPFHDWPEYCYEPNSALRCIGCQHAGIVGYLTRGLSSTNFPAQKDVEFLLAMPNYFIPGERNAETCESFSMALEGFCGLPGHDNDILWMHNKVHIILDGSMGSVGTAANDPLFFLHHSFIDKLFAMWYERYKPKKSEHPNQGVRPGHCRDCFMVGFSQLARNGDMFTSTKNLGYVYDTMLVGEFAQNGKPPVSNSHKKSYKELLFYKKHK